MNEWLKTWTIDQVINGQTVVKRAYPQVEEAVSLFIGPWIKAARNNFSLSVTPANWDSLWMTTNEDSLIVHAPFKLLAIVNRQDLRGNTSYKNKALTAAKPGLFIH